MDVVIVGGGVGGLAAAHGLLRSNHRVRVLERAAGLGRGGEAVTLFSNGLAAAAGLGVPLDDLGGPVDELDFAMADGRRVFRLDLRPLRHSTGHGVATVPRDALVARLARDLPAGVLRHEVGVTSVEVDGVGALVTDAAGEEHRADVVVGADGIRSAVRAACHGLPSARGTGWATCQGMTRVLPTVAAGTSGRYRHGDAGFVGMMPAGDDQVLWWFDVPWADGDERPEHAAAWLRERFSRYADPVPELLGAVSDDVLRFYPHMLLPVTDGWGRGPLTLLGDAAHAFPPSQAQGANQALEDAWSLASALRGTDGPGDVESSLRRYEASRARRVRRVSRMAASEVTERAPGAVTRLAARAVPPALAARAYLRLLRSFSSVLDDDRP